MFVEFNGKQWAKDTLTHTGNRVYYYAKAYNLPGTNFRFKLNENDSSKFDFYDWFIQDHNGATKLVINSNTNVLDPAKKYMNYPYGDTLKTAIVGNFDSDLNAFGSIQNHEMPYSIMGFRIYSEELGRFLSPDPLFEKFDSWTPYHFAFNNPVMYSDPSGLAPKKEKREAGLLQAPDPDFNDSFFKQMNDYFQEQMRMLQLRREIEEGKAIARWDEYERWLDEEWHKNQGASRDGRPSRTAIDNNNNENEDNNSERNNQRGNLENDGDEGGLPGGIPYSNEYLDELENSTINGLKLANGMISGVKTTQEIALTYVVFKDANTYAAEAGVLKSIGKGFGVLTYSADLIITGLDLYDSYNKNIVETNNKNQFYMDGLSAVWEVGITSTAYLLGATGGLAFITTYQVTKYCYNSEYQPYPGYRTFNNQNFPLDNNKVFIPFRPK